MKRFSFICLLIFVFMTTLGLERQEMLVSKEATIVIDAKNTLGEISPLIYGTNIWWAGRFNGIPDSVFNEQDYNQAIAKWKGYWPMAKEMKPAMLRFPGGLDANNYEWKKGVGKIAQRKNIAAGGIQTSPIIGADEFLQFAEYLGAEPLITLRIAQLVLKFPFIVSTPDEAADFVEYTNAKNDGSNPNAGVDWAAERAKNGHPEPYNVKYWELGNEQTCPARGMDTNFYTKEVIIKFSQAMKKIDPTIKIGILDDCDKHNPDWYNKMNSLAGNYFDFWIKHIYSPGDDWPSFGFTFRKPNISLEVNREFPADDNYEFSLIASATNATLNLYLDNELKQGFNVSKNQYYKSTLFVKKGRHSIKLESGNNVNNSRLLQVYPIIKASAKTANLIIDFKNDPKLYSLIQAGILSRIKEIEYTRQFTAKPIFITEWNTNYDFSYIGKGQDIRTIDIAPDVNTLKDALNIAEYYNVFINNDIEAATYWLLFSDGFIKEGQIEGVAEDFSNKERGRSNPRPRPSYYVTKLYSEHLRGRRLKTTTTALTFKVGPDTGITMGYVNENKDVPYVSAVSALSEDNSRLNIAIINKSLDSAIVGKINLNGFSPQNSAKVYTITGDSPDASNDPEDCAGGDCVKIREQTIDYAGSSFSYTLPKQSITLIELKK